MAIEQKVRNRWIVVIGAILIQLALGTIYSWGTLTVFVSPYLNLTMNLDQNIIREVTVYLFGVGLLSFAITMIFAGKLQQKYGPKKIAILGGILIGAGVVVVYFLRLKVPDTQVHVTQKINVSGDVELEEMNCKSCGGTLDSKNVSVKAGAIFIKCPYCDSEYQIEEAPKW